MQRFERLGRRCPVFAAALEGLGGTRELRCESLPADPQGLVPRPPVGEHRTGRHGIGRHRYTEMSGECGDAFGEIGLVVVHAFEAPAGLAERPQFAPWPRSSW